jgi:FlaA1/EpsC-like NDP-sugar epimerase
MIVNSIRKYRILVGDLFILLGSILISFSIRVGLGSFIDFLPSIWLMSTLALIIKPMIFMLFRIYRIYWKYTRSQDYVRLIVSSFVATIALTFSMLLVSPILCPIKCPLSVILIDWIISTFILIIYRHVAYKSSTNEYYGSLTNH